MYTVLVIINYKTVFDNIALILVLSIYFRKTLEIDCSLVLVHPPKSLTLM